MIGRPATPFARGALSWLALAGCALIVGCEPAPLTLVVDLRTDFVPGLEFARVTVGRADERDAETIARRGDLTFLDGVRVAEMHGLARGTHRVRVSLLAEDGRLVADRPVLVDLSASTAVTVVVTRDCFGVVCPPPDEPELQSCFGGVCADPRCLYGEEGCPVECELDADCMNLAACSRARCELGLCFYEHDDSSCGPGQASSGCAPVPSRGRSP